VCVEESFSLSEPAKLKNLYHFFSAGVACGDRPGSLVNFMSNHQYDVVIIGGGIVGLSILHSALIAGYDAVLLERNPDLCDGA
jgi:heterodisulfide reductase subunit A-like polyferredoxin